MNVRHIPDGVAADLALGIPARKERSGLLQLVDALYQKHFDTKAGTGPGGIPRQHGKNLILIEPQSEPLSRSYDYVSILRDNEDRDPARRYKMAYIARGTECGCSVAMTAVSRDGLRWKLMSKDPMTEGGYESSGLVRFNGKYYVSGQEILGPPDKTFAPGAPAGRIMTRRPSPPSMSERRALHYPETRAAVWAFLALVAGKAARARI